MLVRHFEPSDGYRNKDGTVDAEASDVAWSETASGALETVAASVLIRIIDGGPVQVRLNSTDNDLITILTELNTEGLVKNVTELYFSSTNGADLEVFEVIG